MAKKKCKICGDTGFTGETDRCVPPNKYYCDCEAGKSLQGKNTGQCTCHAYSEDECVCGAWQSRKIDPAKIKEVVELLEELLKNKNKFDHIENELGVLEPCSLIFDGDILNILGILKHELKKEVGK